MRGGFDVLLIEEFTTSRIYKEKLKNEFDQMNLSDRHIAILEAVYKQLQNAISSGKDIILIDRSINDRQMWNYRRFIRGEMSEEQYYDARDQFSVISKELIDFLVITYAEPIISLKRDYLSSLALEPRRFLNINNIEEYNNSLNALQELFSKSVDCMMFFDTSNMSMNDLSIAVTSQMLPVMRKKYIKSFQQKHNL